MTASTMEGIPAGAFTVMVFEADTEVPEVAKFRVLVDVNDPEAEFVREPETSPTMEMLAAETPEATTGREKLRVRVLDNKS